MIFTETADGLVVRAPAKLNLFLEVGPLREDGFHPIDSLFQAISLYDRIEFRPRDDGSIVLHDDEIGAGEQNLVHRAAVLLRERLGTVRTSGRPGAGRTRGVEIHLRKGIPSGGGLGGGSSDCAATLLALARLWDADVQREELEEMGAQLGSDVPFFFHGGAARCQGRGEIVTPFHDVFDQQTLHFVIVCPGIPVSTRDVYHELDRRREESPPSTLSTCLDGVTASFALEQIVRGELFFNRLEEVACGLVGALRDVGDWMKAESFRAVQMSGSGSTFFGLAADAEDAQALARRLQTRLQDLRERRRPLTRRDSQGERSAVGQGPVPDGVRILTAAGLPGWGRADGS